jgi:TonB family protein
MLDLTPPTTFSGGGGNAGLQRPPGITRSGENDAFARGVVSALQRTMPQLSDATRGRVTVRITLDRDGSLVSTQVVRPSNIAGLDRYVVFATRQTSYPFPPRNAKPDDLVFLITYIYH